MYNESLYLHVCNSGATFNLTETENGCKLEIATQAFDNLKTSVGIEMSNEGLWELASMLSRAIKHKFPENQNAALAVPLKPYGKLEDAIEGDSGNSEFAKQVTEAVVENIKPIPYPEQADIKGKAEDNMKDKGWL